jgi:hypothetical protein
VLGISVWPGNHRAQGRDTDDALRVSELGPGLFGGFENFECFVLETAQGEHVGQKNAHAPDEVRPAKLDGQSEGRRQVIVDGLELTPLMVTSFKADLGAEKADMSQTVQVAQTFGDGSSLFIECQGLIELAPRLMDLGDLAEGDRPRAHVAELFDTGHFFVDADAQGLVELAAGVMDVGDLAEGDAASTSPSFSKTGSCSSMRMRRASSSSPRA